MTEREVELRGLRNLRRSRGLSQEELGKRVGVGQDAISNYERGNRHPHPSTLRRLAEELGVSIPELYREQPLTAPKAKAPARDHLSKMLEARGGNAIWLLSAGELVDAAPTTFELRTMVRQLAATQRLVREMLKKPGLARGERVALQRQAREYSRKLLALNMHGGRLLKEEAEQLTNELQAAMEVGQEVNA